MATKRMTETMERMLRNLALGKPAYSGFPMTRGHSGGRLQTWRALRERGYIDASGNITDAGRSAAGVAPCDLCARGFPVENGAHYGTQAKGMIPSTPCTASGVKEDQRG